MERAPSTPLEYSRALFDAVCRSRQLLPSAPAPIRFHPGYDLVQRPEAEPLLISGRYGMVLFADTAATLPLAQAGFDFQATAMQITNSPQGLSREKLSRFTAAEQQEVLRRLKSGHFRDELMAALIQVGRTLQSIGVTRITAVPAEFHDKVDRNGGPLAYATAVKVMDAVYARHGFVREEDGDYILRLTK